MMHGICLPHKEELLGPLAQVHGLLFGRSASQAYTPHGLSAVVLPFPSHLPLLVQAQYNSSAKEAESVWTGWTILLIVFLVLAGALWVLDMAAYMRRRREEPIDVVVSPGSD